MLRHFEGRKLLVHKILQFPLTYRGAFLQDDNCRHVFSELVMGNGKGQGLLNGGMIEKGLIDFGRAKFFRRRG